MPMILNDERNVCIIGIDHGYGNIKTANRCFKTGLAVYDSEPLFTKDMLVYNGKYYLVGEGHKEFVAGKDNDDDYYVLTLAAIAMELREMNLTSADVHIAAGLPLTWTAGQKERFREYLTKNETVDFVFDRVNYSLKITGASIYPQGYAAIAKFASALKGVNIIADIGNGTMNTLTLIE